MNDLRYTLLSDGSSDRVLLPILNWILCQNGVDTVQPSWADMARLDKPPQNLADRIDGAVQLHQCDVLFIHRDAERMSRASRIEEIANGYSQVNSELTLPPHVCVVPVRMTEAWLLFDEPAIRYASGNSGNRIPLELPNLNYVEALPNPKHLLYELLTTASALTGRRLRNFRPQQRIHRIADAIDDYSPLRCLPAFSALEDDIRALLETLP